MKLKLFIEHKGGSFEGYENVKAVKLMRTGKKDVLISTYLDGTDEKIYIADIKTAFLLELDTHLEVFRYEV